MKLLMLFAIGIFAGSLITLQSALNAGLGQKTGNLGSVLLLTCVSILVLLLLILLFPTTAQILNRFQAYPSGICILAGVRRGYFSCPHLPYSEDWGNINTDNPRCRAIVACTIH